MKRSRHLLWIGTALVAAACDVGPSEPSSPVLGPVAALYLSSALDVMEFSSIRKHEIDWIAFRETARVEADAAGAQTASDTYPVIVAALERIGDDHSFFRGPGGAQMAPGEKGDVDAARPVAAR